MLAKIQWMDTFLYGGGCEKGGDDVRNCFLSPACGLLVVVEKGRRFASWGWSDVSSSDPWHLLEWFSLQSEMVSNPITSCCFLHIELFWKLLNHGGSWRENYNVKIPTHSIEVLEIKIFRTVIITSCLESTFFSQGIITLHN